MAIRLPLLPRFLLLLTTSVALAATLKPTGTYPRPPVGFEENKGQARPDIRFVSRSPGPNVGLIASSILFATAAVSLSLKGANPNSPVRLPDPLPGVSHVYAGADPTKWVRDIRRYQSVDFPNVLPNLDLRHALDVNRFDVLLTCRPGCDPRQLQFEFSGIFSLALYSDQRLIVTAGDPRGPYRIFQWPKASQNGHPVDIAYNLTGPASFGFRMDNFDSTMPLVIDLDLQASFAFDGGGTGVGILLAEDSGEIYAAGSAADIAGQPARSPEAFGGCWVDNQGFLTVYPCRDASVYRFNRAGDLLWVTYLSGLRSEIPANLHRAKDALVLSGTTDSSDFPVAGDAYQRTFAGQSDYFAVRINPADGSLLTSTYVGRPQPESLGTSHLGADASLYLIGRSFISPTTVLRLDPSLSRVIYSTTLPGPISQTALHTDGSLLFSGWSTGEFPVTPNAYQKEPAGGQDGVIGRLDPTGSKLLYATYIGTAKYDVTQAIKPDPEGGAWAILSSFLPTEPSTNSLLHLDATGSRLLSSTPAGFSTIDVDSAGNVHLFGGPVTPTHDALLSHPCEPGYAKLSPAGEPLFATYLAGLSLLGYSTAGNPLLTGDGSVFELTAAPSTTPFAGCVVNAMALSSGPNTASAGQFITIFGTGLGPREGVTYRLSGNRVPTELAGTRVLLYGQPIPVLYASDDQVNAIMPFAIPPRSGPALAVERGGALSPVYGFTLDFPKITLFTVDGVGGTQALALNQDGTLNSPANPAKLGSVVTLFGTGGGATDPPSLPGEVAPLTELRRLVVEVRVFGFDTDFRANKIEFAGVAPGQLTAVNQFNIRVPAILPASVDRKAVRVNLSLVGSLLGIGATIAVE
ncbi:MAG: hypothetical protein JNN08_19920 [Bryobacterales bacterium]|nr:hypothetical protein [Bryobacterales bacterium]